MNSNKLLYIAVPLLIVFVAWVVWGPKGKQTVQNPGQSDLTISAQEAKQLGVEGDTPRDTLATLVGQMRAVNKSIEDVKKQNDDLARENERLRGREAASDAKVDQAIKKVLSSFQGEFDKVTDDARGQIEDLKGQFNQIGSEPSAATEDLPVGLGFKPGDSKVFGAPFDFPNLPFGRARQPGNTGSTESGSVTDFQVGVGGSGAATFGGAPGIVWVDPSDGIALDPKTGKLKTSDFTFPNAFGSGPLDGLSDAQKKYREVAKGEKDLDKKKRSEGTKEHFTIAENSTLMGSKVMTALIGRVPIDGTVNDPYPFKVLLGKDNLAANGIDLPDVQGAVMTGTATGDWTLSCVRGQIESITFIFEDGTIRTVPEPEATVRRGQSNNSTASLNNIRGGLGYISDPQGIPCVSGIQRSNAQEYLTTQSLVTAAGAAIASVFSKDGTSVASVAGGGYVMSDRNQAMNTILTGGVRDISNWVNKLYGQAFAAIYVPPHADIAVHIDREITIDYEPHGRRVNYHAQSNSITELP